MDDNLKSNLTSREHWTRLVYMIIFALCLQVASIVMWALVVLQFLFALVTGKDNGNLRSFGQSLSEYIYEALQFLTYNSNDKPFPFSSWPEPEYVDEPDATVEPNEPAEEGEVIEANADESPVADSEDDSRLEDQSGEADDESAKKEPETEK